MCLYDEVPQLVLGVIRMRGLTWNGLLSIASIDKYVVINGHVCGKTGKEWRKGNTLRGQQGQLGTASKYKGSRVERQELALCTRSLWGHLHLAVLTNVLIISLCFPDDSTTSLHAVYSQQVLTKHLLIERGNDRNLDRDFLCSLGERLLRPCMGFLKEPRPVYCFELFL